MSNVFQWKNLFKRMCTVNVLVCFVPKRTHTHTCKHLYGNQQDRKSFEDANK